MPALRLCVHAAGLSCRLLNGHPFAECQCCDLQLALILPYVRVGEWITGSPRVELKPVGITDLFKQGSGGKLSITPTSDPFSRHAASSQSALLAASNLASLFAKGESQSWGACCRSASVGGLRAAGVGTDVAAGSGRGVPRHGAWFSAPAPQVRPLQPGKHCGDATVLGTNLQA
jgi:hypothetical protein